MIDPTLALHIAIVTALRADTGVRAIVGVPPADRIYDAVPDAAVKPYIAIGRAQVLPDKAPCIDGADVAFPVHGWANGPETAEIKALGAAILAALDPADGDDEPLIAVAGHRVIRFEVEQAQYLDDPDPNTQHVAIIFRAHTEPL